MVGKLNTNNMLVCLDGRADNNVAHTGMTVLDRPEPE